MAAENLLDRMKRLRVEENIVPNVSDEQVADLLSLVNSRLAKNKLDTFRLRRNSAAPQIFTLSLASFSRVGSDPLQWPGLYCRPGWLLPRCVL